MNRQRTIEHLQDIHTRFKDYSQTGILLSPVGCQKLVEWIEDALVLLNAGELVKPERKRFNNTLIEFDICGNCKTTINPNDRFCHECGCKVKWN